MRDVLELSLYEALQLRAAAGDAVVLNHEQVRALVQELTIGRTLRAREQQLVAALKAVEYGLVGITATAPACPACRAACGMGHYPTCSVGSALSTTVSAED